MTQGSWDPRHAREVSVQLRVLYEGTSKFAPWRQAKLVEAAGLLDAATETIERERLEHQETRGTVAAWKALRTWECGCGWTNGVNLATCAQCGRSPGATT